MELDVRHLKAICAIAEAGSMRRASATLQTSQPALTAQLQRIERMLGGLLFQRSQDGTTPTPLGEYVVGRARALLTAFDDLQHGISARVDWRGRISVRIGTMDGPLLSGLLTWLRQAYPDADVTTVTGASSQPLAGLTSEGRLDLAILGDCPGYELDPGPGVVAHFAVTEPVFALLSTAHPLADRTELRLSDLAEDPWILALGDADRCWEYYYDTFERAGIELRVRHQVGGSVLKDLVRAGHGVSLCQATSPGGPGLTIRRLAGTPLWYRHCVLWRREHPIAGQHRLLTHALADVYTSSAEGSATYGTWLKAHRLTIADVLAAEAAEPFGITGLVSAAT